MDNNASEISIVLADANTPSDHSLVNLLDEVYVAAGYTDPAVAQSLFEPAAVRRRGHLYAAIESSRAEFVGMVILVPPDSEARQLAKQDEAELHLLAVKPAFRGRGVGKKLMQAATDHAIRESYRQLILWTQPSMLAAQALYESVGFIYVETFSRGNKSFRLFRKSLISSAGRN